MTEYLGLEKASYLKWLASKPAHMSAAEATSTAAAKAVTTTAKAILIKVAAPLTP